MNHKPRLSNLVAAALAALLTFPVAAQEPDPAEIAEIARRIDEQLQEIDKLLLDSGKKGASRTTPKTNLRQSNDRSQTVEQGIDELIQKLEQMKSRSQSQSESQSQSQNQQNQDSQPQDGQQQQNQRNQQQGRQNRRENQTPDFVQREPQQQPGEQPQPGEQQQQQPGQQRPGEQNPDRQGNPRGDQEVPDPGRNTPGNQPPADGTGPGSQGNATGEWGDLPPYLNSLKNRGSAPKVPEKFRRYWEAYLKQKQDGGKKQ